MNQGLKRADERLLKEGLFDNVKLQSAKFSLRCNGFHSHCSFSITFKDQKQDEVSVKEKSLQAEATVRKQCLQKQAGLTQPVPRIEFRTTSSTIFELGRLKT